MRLPRALLAALPLVLALPACDGDDDAPACTPELEKRAVEAIVRDAYLYTELLPSAVDPALPTPSALLDAMTAEARARGMDRGWSYLTTVAASQAFFEEGKAVGFGFGLAYRDGAVRVAQVYGGSPAEAAGFRRGDTLLRVGEPGGTLADVTVENVGQLLGPSAEGVTRIFVVRPAGASGEAAPREVAKAVFDLDPVPVVGEGGERFRVFERDGRKVGYVALRTFIRTAEPHLEAAFAALGERGVTDVVVDLRYNGGGLVSTAEVLANLLGGGLATNEVMYRVRNNARWAPLLDGEVRFAPRPASVAPARVAFVMTGASASASELVANALEPHRDVAIVGARTYGKPVGQRGFRIRGCDTLAYVVSFRLDNQQGDGAYFDGLPDGGGAFGGPLCEAADDLEQALGSAAEASTEAALAWIAGDGTCAPPAAAGLASKQALRVAPDGYPEAPEPTPAQRHVRGLF